MLKKKIYERKGAALTSMLLAAVCSIFILASAFTIYDKAKKRDNSSQVTLQTGNAIQNIRTYFLFDGSYKNIKNLTGTDLVSKGLFSNNWKCSGLTCNGPDNVSVTLASASSNTKFTLKFQNVKQYMCIDITKYRWPNLDAIKIGSKKSSSVPATADFAIKNCAANNNTITLTF